MEEMKKAYLIDVKNKTSKEVNIKDDLDEFYEIIDCRMIDIVTRKINGKYYDIVCDDEGLFHEKPVASAYDLNCKPMLVGNLLVFNVGEDGELGSLEAEDVIRIKEAVFTVPTEDGSIDILFCEY